MLLLDRDLPELSLMLLRTRALTGLLLTLLRDWALTGLLLTLLLPELPLLRLLLGGLLLMLLLSGARTGLLLQLGERLLSETLFGLTLGLLLKLLLGLMLMLLLLVPFGLKLRLLDLPGGPSKSGCLSALLSDLASVSTPLLRSSPFSLREVRFACSRSSI